MIVVNKQHYICVTPNANKQDRQSGHNTAKRIRSNFAWQFVQIGPFQSPGFTKFSYYMRLFRVAGLVFDEMTEPII